MTSRYPVPEIRIETSTTRPRNFSPCKLRKGEPCARGGGPRAHPPSLASTDRAQRWEVSGCFRRRPAVILKPESCRPGPR